MKIICWHIFKHVVIAFLITMGVATFVLLIGQFARVFDMVSRGAPLMALLSYIVLRLPQTLCYTIPIGLFISTVFVFNRLSEENEILALRASGLNLLQISAPVLFLGLILSLLCVKLQIDWAPNCNYLAKTQIRHEGVKNPQLLIEAGQFVEIFTGYIVYVGSKENDMLSDIHLYVLDEQNRIQEKINAHHGRMVVKEELQKLELTLSQATIETSDPNHPADATKNKRIQGETLTIPLDYSNQINRKSVIRRISEMRLSQILAHLQILTERGIETTPLYFEILHRAAISLSPFSFVLLALPLGIKAQRRDSYSHLVVCVLAPFAYYTFYSLFETWGNNPIPYWEYLIWLPNIIFQISGLYLFWRKR